MDVITTIQEIQRGYEMVVFMSFCSGFIVSFISLNFIMSAETTKLKLRLQEKCPHNNTHTYVDSVTPCCETTTVTCLDCDKTLSNKTDCR